MAIQNITLLNQVRLQLINKPASQTKAIQWFQKLIKEHHSGVRARAYNKPLRQDLLQNQQKSTLQIGSMYFMVYDAKWKHTLPYWDAFPLIFPIEMNKSEGYMVGMNFHYLNYKTRFALLNKLYDLASNKNLTDTTKLKLTYKFLKSSTNFPEIKPCLKKYLFTHIKSKPMLIGAPDWATALFLPVDDFQKKNKTYVWNASSNMIGN